MHTLHCYVVPVQASGLLQNLKHVILEHVQPLVARFVHIRPDDLKVQRGPVRVGRISGGDLRQRVAVATALVVLVTEHGHEQAADEVLDEAGHVGHVGVFAPLQVPPRLQEHPVQDQGVLVDERLGLVVRAGVVEHEHQVLHQRVHVLVLVGQHVTLDLLHVHRLLDGHVVVGQLGTRRQAQEDGAETAAALVRVVLHRFVELVQLLLQRGQVLGFLRGDATLPCQSIR